MQVQPRGGSSLGVEIDRRTWLAAAVAACVGGSCLAQEAKGPNADEDEEVRAVEAVGNLAALRPFRVSRSEHFLCIGDGLDGFRSLTLRDCEAVAADYLDHYRAQGFKVALPDRRLTVVGLANDRSFAAYSSNKRLEMIPKRIDPGPSVHGLYYRSSNRLVLFDHKSLGPQLGARSGHQNLRTLAHEVTHQLSFNTGLLARKGGVPTSVVEGLAMYGEVRKSTGRSAPGQPNRMRINDLATTQRRKIAWIPVDQLLADDGLVSNPATHKALLAYAESWLLVDYLMKDRSRLPMFRAYLEASREPRDPDERLDVARRHLGDLDQLDEELRRYSQRLLRGE